MGCDVTAYSGTFPTPLLTLASGETPTADIIVAANGIELLVRYLVLGARNDPVSSGYARFRAYLEPSAEMRADPTRKVYLAGDSVNFWIWPDMHVV